MQMRVFNGAAIRVEAKGGIIPERNAGCLLIKSIELREVKIYYIFKDNTTRLDTVPLNSPVTRGGEKGLTLMKEGKGNVTVSFSSTDCSLI